VISAAENSKNKFPKNQVLEGVGNTWGQMIFILIEIKFDIDINNDEQKERDQHSLNFYSG
jgi:hypothetical protein